MNRLVVLAIAAVALIAVVIGVVAAIRKDGARDALTHVQEQNTGAGNAADDDRTRFDLCPVGMWDFGAGKCRGPAARGGH